MNGYIALISIIIISVLSLLIAFSAILMSVGESAMGLEENKSWEAFYLANLCAEEALINLKNNLNYTGGEILNFGDKRCEILSVGGAGNQNRVIKVSGFSANRVRKILIVVKKVNPVLQIESWSEVF